MTDFNNSANPILVQSYRGGIVESFHRGSFCVVDKKGEVIWSMGDIQQLSFPRSALKYFQQIPFLLSGGFDHLGFGPKELAIMCASHNGEDMHLTVVNDVLSKVKLNKDSLQCGAQQPTRKSDYIRLIKNDLGPSCIHNNCSGKHAGFLAYCVQQDYSIIDYLNLQHPLHQAIKAVTAQFCEMNSDDLSVGVDGCSAPIFGMPLYNQALAYKNLIAPMPWKNEAMDSACKRIVHAVTNYPELIAGTKRYCTDLMRVTNGRIVGKTGADGVYCLSIPEKTGVLLSKLTMGKWAPNTKWLTVYYPHWDCYCHKILKR